MPKNNEFVNKVNNSSHVSTSAHDTGNVNEPFFLSDYSRNEINSLRGDRGDANHTHDRGYLYSTKAHICDAMSGLLELTDTRSDEDRELYQRVLLVLCDYRRLVDELSKVEV